MIAGDRLRRDEEKARDAVRNGERIEVRMVAVGSGGNPGGAGWVLVVVVVEMEIEGCKGS